MVIQTTETISTYNTSTDTIKHTSTDNRHHIYNIVLETTDTIISTTHTDPS